jgi:CHAP domain
VSGRHAKTRAFPQRVKFSGAIIGATAISLIAATPFYRETHAPPVRAVTLKLLAYPRAKPAIRQAPAGRLGHWAPTAADALRLAIAQVGVTEDADGGGTIYQKWFVSSPWAVRGVQRDGGSIGDYADANWCDMFISWIGAQLSVKGMGADAFTPTHAQWFKDQGRWGQTPTPGAIVFFSWSGGKSIDDIDHVGMVIKDNHDGTIQTVEGNTDDAVRIRTRDVSAVVGYGYPQYAPAKTR